MEKLIAREKSQKLYIQLHEILRKKIESGEWAVNSQIPTEDELCVIYEVSKATVRQSIAELARQGYLIRQQGKGTFVCKRIISEGLTMLTGFKEMMLEIGIDFTTKVLAQTVVMPTDDLNVKLNIADDRHIIYVKRLREVDDEPVLIQEAFIPHSLCPEMLEEDVSNNSLLELLEKKYELKVTRVKDYIEVAYLNADESALLGLPDGSAALLLEQHFYSGDTQIMYMRTVKRPERFRLQIEFERKIV